MTPQSSGLYAISLGLSHVFADDLAMLEHGLVMYDADVYPEQYRGKLLMGNLHGSCINTDKLTRDGSTYKQSNEPDFLSANDAWFMPVSQKLGPDGCVYIMDWYDRYHCYQDANRDQRSAPTETLNQRNGDILL